MFSYVAGSRSRHSPSGRDEGAAGEPGPEPTKARPPNALIPRSPPIRAVKIERSMKASCTCPLSGKREPVRTRLGVRTARGEFLARAEALSCCFFEFLASRKERAGVRQVEAEGELENEIAC